MLMFRKGELTRKKVGMARCAVLAHVQRAKRLVPETDSSRILLRACTAR